MMPKEVCTIAVQTEDFGCGNGCTSMYIMTAQCNAPNKLETLLGTAMQFKPEKNSEDYIKDISSKELDSLSSIDIGCFLSKDRFDNKNAADYLLLHSKTMSVHSSEVNVEHRFDYSVVTELCNFPASSVHCETQSNKDKFLNFAVSEPADHEGSGVSTALETQQNKQTSFDIHGCFHDKYSQKRELNPLGNPGQDYNKSNFEEMQNLTNNKIVLIENEPFSNRENNNNLNQTKDEEKPTRTIDANQLIPSESDTSGVVQGSGRCLLDVDGRKELCMEEDAFPFYSYSSLNLVHNQERSTKIPSNSSDTLLQCTSFACTHCAKEFKRKSNLTRHVRIHTGEKPFACPHCAKRFSEKTAFNYHLKIHSNEKPFQCSHCQMKFRDKKTLSNHLKIHTGNDLFECQKCNKTYTTNSHLQRHLKVHTGERPFKCSDCERCFADKHELTRHHVVHSGEKRFQCSYCGKKFARKKYISDHERIHSGEKPFNCPHCEKCFTQRNGLRKHIRLHTGEKPHECNHCDKRFSEKSILNSHLRTHSGEKPYKCNHCEKDFSEKGNLKRHLRIHTVDTFL